MIFFFKERVGENKMFRKLQVKLLYVVCHLFLLVGFSAACEEDTKKECFQKLSSEAKQIVELCSHENIWDDYYDIQIAIEKADISLNAGDLEQAYESLKIAFYGKGESEYSQKLTKLIEKNKKCFCNNDLLFAENNPSKLLEQDLDFELYVWSIERNITNRLSNIANILARDKWEQKEMDAAIKLKKESLFWHLFKVKVGYEVTEWLYKDFLELKSMMKKRATFTREASK